MAGHGNACEVISSAAADVRTSSKRAIAIDTGKPGAVGVRGWTNFENGTFRSFDPFDEDHMQMWRKGVAGPCRMEEDLAHNIGLTRPIVAQYIITGSSMSLRRLVASEGSLPGLIHQFACTWCLMHVCIMPSWQE